MVTSRDVAAVLARCSGRPNAETDVATRVRNMTGVAIPKGTGGKGGAGMAPLGVRDAVLMVLGMSADQGKNAPSHAIGLAGMIGERGKTLVEALEAGLHALIENRGASMEGAAATIRLPRFCLPELVEVEVRWLLNGEWVDERFIRPPSPAPDDATQIKFGDDEAALIYKVSAPAVISDWVEIDGKVWLKLANLFLAEAESEEESAA